MKKLVRDNIPTLAPQKTFYKASLEEYAELLLQKLREETEEFLQNPSQEEMADIVEVLLALCDTMHISFQQVEKMRQQKVSTNGAFQDRWVLK
jgi:predicted house-cleaning noncanonical NTP pyrophosphatase (MazG superfamily)